MNKTITALTLTAACVGVALVGAPAQAVTHGVIAHREKAAVAAPCSTEAGSFARVVATNTSVTLIGPQSTLVYVRTAASACPDVKVTYYAPATDDGPAVSQVNTLNVSGIHGTAADVKAGQTAYIVAP